uniref:Uncharacterized protein n=1 Tax=Lepeophtheirus salmonis TaxID=72036 RepID=A0A0K2TFQ6_LEPSM
MKVTKCVPNANMWNVGYKKCQKLA